MYWTTENFQDICVNRPSTTLHEDGVMFPKLPIEHLVDDNHTFLTTLIFLYKFSITVLIVVSCIGPQRTKMGSYTKRILRMMWTMYGRITLNVQRTVVLLKQKKVVGDEESPISDEPDPYDYVYDNLPDNVHVIKPIDDCKKCGAKRFQYETKGFCCRDGQVKLAEQETPPG
jgi:hypothetical protein